MFRKFSYRGVELDDLLTLSTEKFVELVHCRARRRMTRGLKHKPMALIKRIRKSVAEATGEDKPAVGKVFNQVEIKPEMVGHYLGEFSITYKLVAHGRPGVGATGSSKFVPLK